MTIQKRNDLANKAAVAVPDAISALRLAEQHIQHNEPDQALKWIRAAQVHLDHLTGAVVEAYRERAADEGGHLVGDED
jgi:hypothetical protein